MATPLGRLEGAGDHDVGRGEGVARYVGGALELPRDQPPPALERLSRPAGGPVALLTLGREHLRGDDRIDRTRESGFAEQQELLVNGKCGIERIGRKRRRAVAGQEVFHDRHGFDHRHLSVHQRGDEARGIYAEKLRVVLNAGEEVDRAQAIGKPHLFEQPDDPKAPAFAEDRDHAFGPPILGGRENRATKRSASA